MIATVLVAAGIGAAAVIIARDLPSPATTTPASSPSQQAPVQQGGNGGPGPGALPGGGTAEMFIGGEVTAVSSTSITISGPAGSGITAAVTAATKITGSVSSITGIKVGDQVSAQLTRNGSKVTAVAIQYPAQQPGGGSPP
jgi:hypothetical protein